MHKLTFIDLFAGIGGIRIAFENVGARCIYSSEWDEDCQKTYAANFGETPAGDITKIAATEIPDHDILTGGFPCQAFSVIGKRQGLRDTRGTLFFEAERILREKRPYAFLLENVKQLVTIDQGQTFKTMLAKLKELGYYVHYRVLNALDFGVPQKRERVIIVGFQKNHPFQFPQKSEKKLTLADILEPHDSVHPKHFISDRIRDKLAKRVKEKPSHPTIWHENKSGNIGIHEFSCALRSNASYSYLLVDGIRRPTPRELLRLMGFRDTYKIVVSDFAIRKQAGNSVVIPMIEAVARAMIEAMKITAIEDERESARQNKALEEETATAQAA